MATRATSSRDKVRVHRARLWRRGLRPIQIWVPDVRSRRFAREAHRQSALVGHAASQTEEQEYIDAISESPAE